MLRKIITGLLAAAFIYLLPAAGNTEALGHPQLWILFVIGMMVSVFQPTYKPIDETAPKHDRGTAAQIVWSVYLTQIFGVIEAIYFRYPESFRWDLAATVALVVALSGMGLRIWAVLTLGRYFTWHIDVYDDHQVIRTGPFRWIRHPAYCGAFFLFVATLVFLHAWVGALLSATFQLWAYVRRIRHEESLMVERMGEPYVAYIREVKAFLPLIW